VALQTGAAEEVVLASGEKTGYADALTGTYFAGTRDVPMLLTRRGSTPASTLSAIKLLGAKRVYVLGGPSAISEGQLDHLKSLGYQVSRISGDDRYATNAKVIDTVGDSRSDTAIVATGQTFPDALASGPLAYNEGMPLALTKAQDIPDVVVNALLVARVKHVVIVGGTNAVGPQVEKELNAAGITVSQRISGADRSETSVLIAKYAVDTLNFSKSAIDVASGAQAGTGADALAASALAGKLDRPLVITATGTNPDDVIGYLKGHAGTLIGGTIFGGTAAITQATEDEMEATVNNNRPKP
jgi:putative cell wall-binding protein